MESRGDASMPCRHTRDTFHSKAGYKTRNLSIVFPPQELQESASRYCQALYLRFYPSDEPIVVPKRHPGMLSIQGGTERPAGISLPAKQQHGVLRSLRLATLQKKDIQFRFEFLPRVYVSLFHASRLRTVSVRRSVKANFIWDNANLYFFTGHRRSISQEPASRRHIVPASLRQESLP